MYTIATLEALRGRLNLAEGDRGSDDELRRALQEASHLIELATGRRYCPRVATLMAPPDRTAPGSLLLPDDLLELHGVRDEGGALNLADLRLLPGDDDQPASVLQLRPGLSFRLGQNGESFVSVSGVWGWHDRWTTAWRASGDKVRDSALSATAATITVEDCDGLDEDGARPRFQVGQTLRIASEYLRVTAIDRAANQLTVLRGVDGSRAAAHAINTAIATYAPAPAIRDLCLRYAELMAQSAGPLELESASLRRMRRLTA